MSQSRRRIAAAPLIVLVMGLACTGLASAWAWRNAAEIRAERLDRLAARAELTLTGRLETYVALLRAGAGLFAASEQVTEREFAEYSRRLDLTTRYPGVQGIGFSQALGTEAPPFSRIDFIQPMDRRNAAAMGYDMYGEPVRRAAMARARDEGTAAATARVTLKQEIEDRKQPGFLIYVPVYRGGAAPTTVEARRARLAGWSYAAFRAEDFLQASFAQTDLLQQVRLEVRDGDGAPLFASDPGAAPGAPARETTRRTVQALGRTWTLTAQPGPRFEAPSPVRATVPVALGGLLTTLLLTVGSFAQHRAVLRARAAESKARAAHAETELLLKEVNHRVANSLQLVNSLVGMQAASVTEPAARAALADTQARILAIARVHQRLYTGGDASCVDLKDYLENLVGELAASLGADERRRLTLEAVGAELSTDKAVALGVVVAELVTNAFKYAYPPGASGEVRVILEKTGAGLTLAVEDDGVGLPATPSPRGTGMGMRVVRAMAATLGAKLETAPRPAGTRVTLAFQDGC